MYYVGHVVILIFVVKIKIMEKHKETSLNKRIDQLYKFCVHIIRTVNPSGNLVRKIPKPVPRSGHRIVYFKGNIFAFGGYSARDPVSDQIITEIENRQLFKELWKFNFATKTWFNVETSGTMPMELASHGAVLAENCILVYGGTGFPFGQRTTNNTYLCNLESFEWFTLSTTGDHPHPMYGQAIALHKRKLYVIGGTTGFDYAITVHCLDLCTKEWTRLDNVKTQSFIPSSRYRHEIAILGDKIFIFGGGTSEESFNLNEIPTFNLTENTWSLIVTKTTSGFPSPRLCHGSVQVGSDVYICGGHDGETIYSDIWKINLKQLQWNKLKIELPMPLYFHSVAISPEGQLFIFGGVTNTEQEIRTNALYSVWLTIPSLSDICWEAIVSYIPNIALMDKQKLYKLGVPLKYLQQTDFYSNTHRKRKQAPSGAKF